MDPVTRRFATFVLTEDLLIAGAEALMYLECPSAIDAPHFAATVALICLGFAVTDVVLYLAARDATWEELGRSDRVCRAFSSVAAAFATFFVAFAAMGALVYVSTPLLLLASAAYAIGGCTLALVAIEVSRKGLSETIRALIGDQDEEEDWH